MFCVPLRCLFFLLLISDAKASATEHKRPPRADAKRSAILSNWQRDSPVCRHPRHSDPNEGSGHPHWK